METIRVLVVDDEAGVLVLHHQVEDRQIRADGEEHFAGFVFAGGGEDFVPIGGQDGPDLFDEVGVVVHYEDLLFIAHDVS